MKISTIVGTICIIVTALPGIIAQLGGAGVHVPAAAASLVGTIAAFINLYLHSPLSQATAAPTQEVSPVDTSGTGKAG